MDAHLPERDAHGSLGSISIQRHYRACLVILKQLFHYNLLTVSSLLAVYRLIYFIILCADIMDVCRLNARRSGVW